jgi:uncharacterized protein YydD (DUF2326 family)
LKEKEESAKKYEEESDQLKTENTSLKEDTDRLKTDILLLLQDVLVKDAFTRSIQKEKKELISKNDSRLKKALFEVSSLKQEVTNLNKECCRILKEKEESAEKYEEEILCLKSYVAYLQMKINELESTLECPKQVVEDKSCLSEASEKKLINLPNKEDEIVNRIWTSFEPEFGPILNQYYELKGQNPDLL